MPMPGRPNPRKVDTAVDIPADFKSYITSLLSGAPELPPDVPAERWIEFFASLRTHFITPLLFLRTASLPHKFQPPQAVMDKIRKTFMGSRVRSMRMERQLSEIVRAFEEKGVELVILKGVALAWSIYPDPAARPYTDLDILVKPGRMDGARQALDSLGYRPLSRTFTEIFSDIGCEEVYEHADGTYRSVELHWDLYLFHGIVREVGIEDMFGRAVEVNAPFGTFQALHPVDGLVHAAIHLIKGHGDEKRLIWVYDIALLAGRLSVPDDWAALQERCVEWRGRAAVEDALKLAARWTGLALPSGFDDFTKWPAPAEVEFGEGSKSHQDNWLTGLLSTYRRTPRTGALGKARFWLRLAFPGPGHVRMHYPPRHGILLPVSYVRRWLSWFGKL